jgi:hypothetical protein
MVRLRIYRNDLERAVLGLTIGLDRKGKATLKRGEDAQAAEFLVNLVGNGVPIIREPLLPTGRPRVVKPEDGMEYLDEVQRMLGNSTRWLVAREDE